MSFTNRVLYFFHLILMPFIYLSCLVLGRTSSVMWNTSGESGRPCLAPDLNLRKNAFSLSPLRIMLPVSVS